MYGKQWRALEACSRGDDALYKSRFTLLYSTLCTCYRISYIYVNTGSREAALVHASMAAGIMYSVSRACRDGRIPACGCSRRRPGGRQVRWAETTATPAAGDWQWGGCSDNTDYGYRFATSFVDARQREKNYPRHSTPLKRMLMNLHDNEAGRLVRTNCNNERISLH